MKNELLRIGSRGSGLALWQASWVRETLLRSHPGLEVTVEIIKTTGDKVLESPLSRMSSKGIFTREIEEALLDQRIDLAVHSLKDIPTQLPEGLTIGAISEREDVRDVFIPRRTNARQSLEEQEANARIATGSLRRRCQLLNRFPGFEIVDIRGNLDTRIRKLDSSPWEGMILARAGVIRLGLLDRVGEILDISVMMPAVGQGALGVEIRNGDDRTGRFVQSVHDRATAVGTNAERALLHRLQGGCQVPVGAYGRIETTGDGETLVLDGMVGSLDGRSEVRGKVSGSIEEAEQLGIRLAEALLSRGADRILDEIRTGGLDGDAGVAP